MQINAIIIIILYILFELILSVAALVPVATTSRDSVMSTSIMSDIFIGSIQKILVVIEVYKTKR